MRGSVLEGLVSRRDGAAERPHRDAQFCRGADAARQAVSCRVTRRTSFPRPGPRLNLAVADVRLLARALGDYYASGRTERLDRYSEACLRRVWRVQRFSWWMTALLHRFPNEGTLRQRLQLAELDYLTGSRAALTGLAENYVGLPFDD